MKKKEGKDMSKNKSKRIPVAHLNSIEATLMNKPFLILQYILITTGNV